MRSGSARPQATATLLKEWNGSKMIQTRQESVAGAHNLRQVTFGECQSRRTHFGRLRSREVSPFRTHSIEGVPLSVLLLCTLWQLSGTTAMEVKLERALQQICACATRPSCKFGEIRPSVLGGFDQPHKSWTCLRNAASAALHFTENSRGLASLGRHVACAGTAPFSNSKLRSLQFIAHRPWRPFAKGGLGLNTNNWLSRISWM